jgi:uncharacterized protein (TIGR02001 family)
MNRLLLAGVAALAVAAASPSQAADAFYSQEQIASAIDIAFGLTATSRYVSRGYDYSGGPALQGYVEGSYEWVYLGAWASSVGGPNIDPTDNIEFNAYGGIRPTFGDLSLDLGYARYFYDRTGDAGGEFYGKASYEISDIGLTPGIELYWDPQARANYGLATAALALPYDFELSGGVGTTFRGNVDWNAGISYTYAETFKLDLRYHGSNRNDPDMFRHKFVASVSVESSISALRGMMAR